MTESLRELLYPLGFLSALMFGGRFLVQWIASEVNKRSIVPPLFWKLSLAGNLALLAHAFIQLQYHVFLIQVCNAIISWRNLNLMQPHERQISFRSTLALLVGASVGSTLLYMLASGGEWFRIPSVAWIQNPQSLSALWHLFGFVGIALFAARFWVQWWCAEMHGHSYLGKAFWWLSLIGNLMMLLYFYMMGDPVNVIGPIFGLIPYIRNLMLLQKEAA